MPSPRSTRAVPARRRQAAATARPSTASVLRTTGLALTVAALLATAAVVASPADTDAGALTGALTGATEASRAAASHDASLLRVAGPGSSAAAPRMDLDLLPVLDTAHDAAIPQPLLPETDTGLAAEGDKAANKLAKKLAKLDTKLASAEDKLAVNEAGLAAWTDFAAQAELDVDAAEAALAAAYQQLADALAMPDGTPEEQQAKADAVAAAKKAVKAALKGLKVAKKALKAANKKVAKYTKGIDKSELKIAGLIIKLETIDPGHFADVGVPELAGQDAEGQVTFTWAPVADADSYNLYWGVTKDVTKITGIQVPGVSSPFVATAVAPGVTVFAVVTAVNETGEGAPSNEATSQNLQVGGGGGGDPSIYFPVWADITPQNVITLDHDSGLSDEDNGAILRTAVLGLQPGDRLEVGGGTWSIVSKFSPSASGTANDPVWIVAQDGETPIITRPDANQNVMNPSGEYMCFRGLEITGGSAGMKFDVANNIWIDQCHIHDIGEAGIAANSGDTSKMYITRNHIHDTAGYGEGMYLGANNGAVIMSESVIALNIVHDTSGPNVLQGDGIELKQGSWGNWIAENTVYNTNYPCLLAYGTDGMPVNLIERNTLIGSGDNVMQVQGEAIVRSNLIVNGATGFQSNDHQGQTRDLTFVHNTVINTGQAIRLANWDGRPGMVFANNAVYTQGSTAVQFSSGSSGVTITGNVVYGGVSGASATGFTAGVGLADFEDANWSGLMQDVTPATPDSTLLGAGDPAWAVPADLGGDGFGGAPAAGAMAGP